jgi:hypothetical protein
MSALAPITQANPLALYDRMCTAIAECSRVDEAKDIRDKALALEAYYRQARNLDAEREAANVRLRAERRVGELLKELARAETPNPQGIGGKSAKIDTSAHRTQQSPYAAALHDQGISRQAAHRFQNLAAIPQEDFERALSGPEKVSTSSVLRAAPAPRPAPPTPAVSDDALWVWGRLRDFENRGLFNADARRLLSSMTAAMRADVRRLIPHVSDLLSELESAHEPA